jgi:hypothetical protein
MKIKENLVRGLKLMAILFVAGCASIPVYILVFLSSYYEEWVSAIILYIIAILVAIYASGHFVHKYKDWLFK